MSGPNGERCETCYFFTSSQVLNHGECHRFPPVDRQANRHVPSVISREGWCGEFRELKEHYDASIHNLNIYEKTKATLNSRGVCTIGELLAFSKMDLLAMPGVGHTSVWKIENSLDELGLKLRMY